MAKRYLEKIAINGTEYNLLGFTSYDFLPSTATGTYIYSASGNNFPYGISAGYDFSNDSSLFPTLSSEGISHDLDNYVDTYIKKYMYEGSTAAFGVFYNNNALILAGWMNNSQENTTQCSIGIILDDENEIGWILERVYFSPTRNVTSIACKGGNTTDGQLIYSIFGNPVAKFTSNGGGATHIAKVTGQLKDLSSNLSDILMVSGGGGGGLLVGETDYSGKEAGGISGSGDNSADQSTGNAFGQGESGTNASGGGSGLYGGYKGTSAKSGGAGSGYIGNSLVSNKKMIGYNVPTSDVERYKTETTNEFSAIAQANKPKMGNGYVIIKFLRDEGDDDMHTYSESEHRVGTWTNGKPVYERIVTVNEFAGTNNQWINTGVNIPNGDEIVFVGFAQAHALSDGFLFNCFAKFNEDKNVLAYFATGTYTYYYSRCLIQYTKTTD